MAKSFLVALAAVSLTAAPVFAQTSTTQPSHAQEAGSAEEARIPFADSIGIRDWRADGRSAVYIQDNRRQWYRAELFMPAPSLPFVFYIGIDAGPTGTLDKFGAIYVDGQRYPLRSLVRVADPTATAAQESRGGQEP